MKKKKDNGKESAKQRKIFEVKRASLTAVMENLLGDETLDGSGIEKSLLEAGSAFESFPPEPIVRDAEKIEAEFKADENGLLRIFAKGFPFCLFQSVWGINRLELYGWRKKTMCLGRWRSGRA